MRNRMGKKLYILIILLAITLSGLTAGPEKNRELSLSELLQGTARYCEKLNTAVFHFFCNEDVSELVTRQFVFTKEKSGMKNFLDGERGMTRATESLDPRRNASMYRAMNARRSSRNARRFSAKKMSRTNEFINDYQIIRQSGKIKERRILLKLNGKKVNRENPGLQSIIHSYRNAMVPVYLLSRKNQKLYRYAIEKKGSVKRKKPYVLSIKENNAGKEQPPMAMVWVDPNDFSVKKMTLSPRSIAGYEKLVKPGKLGRDNLEIFDEHKYGIARNGLRFPTRTEIKISYDEEPAATARDSSGKVKAGSRVNTTIHVVFTYRKYRFFAVNVANPEFID